MATPKFWVRDPDQVNLVIGAIVIDSGFADGSQIKIEAAGDSFKLKKGIRGDVARSKTNDRTGTITFRLMASSPFNAVLSAQHNNDVAKPNGAGVVAAMVQDKNGASLDVASKAWLRKIPPQDYAEEDTPVEWVLDCADLKRMIGGNG